MPFYKGVYFPDGSVPMSHADISAVEASSIDDVIGDIRYGGFVDTVANIIERDEKYPTPSEGFPIWLADAGCEQRYVGGQWVGYSEGMMPVPIQSAIPSGSGSTFKLLGVGGIEFTSCQSIILNNIFTNDFDNYKIIAKVNSTNSASPIWFRFTSNGVSYSTNNTIRTAYGGNTTTAYVLGSTTGTAIASMATSSLTRNSISELHLMRPHKRYYPMGFTTSSYNSDSSATNEILKMGFQVNNASAPAFDGIQIYSDNGTSLLTGSAKVYGYN